MIVASLSLAPSAKAAQQPINRKPAPLQWTPIHTFSLATPTASTTTSLFGSGVIKTGSGTLNLGGTLQILGVNSYVGSGSLLTSTTAPLLLSSGLTKTGAGTVNLASTIRGVNTTSTATIATGALLNLGNAGTSLTLSGGNFSLGTANLNAGSLLTNGAMTVGSTGVLTILQPSGGTATVNSGSLQIAGVGSLGTVTIPAGTFLSTTGENTLAPSVAGPQPVPEPSVVILGALGAALFAARRRRS